MLDFFKRLLGFPAKQEVPVEAPYKVETKPVELGKPADDRVEATTPVPLVVEAKPVVKVEAAPAKAPTAKKERVPAKPKATPTPKAPAKATAITAKPKAPAKPKAAPKKSNIRVAK
jgi:monoamine oxidase